MASVVVDESSWVFFDVSLEKVVAAICHFLATLKVCRERGEQVEMSATLFNAPLVLELWNTSGRFPIEHDLRIRLRTALSRIPCWDEEVIPDMLPVQISGHAVGSAPSVSFAREVARTGRSVGCLVLPLEDWRRGKLYVVNFRGEPGENIWFIADEVTHVSFFRDAILLNANPRTFEECAKSAFPSLGFADDVWSGLRDFSKPYTEIKIDLIRILGQLSDEGRRIFGWNDSRSVSEATNKDVESRFSGYALAPESKYHLDDARVTEARTRVFGGQRLVFSWHVKISPDRDRVHIYEPIKSSNGCVVIGIFAKHLRLRGD